MDEKDEMDKRRRYAFKVVKEFKVNNGVMTPGLAFYIRELCAKNNVDEKSFWRCGFLPSMLAVCEWLM